MLFTFKDFEQHFKESVLRRGMKLFESNQVEMHRQPSGNSYHYLVKGVDLFVKRSGDKILSCSCACGSKSYCEHLSALLFYLHSDKLLYESRKDPKSEKRRKASNRKGLQADYEKGRNKWKTNLTQIRELFKPFGLKVKLDQKLINEVASQLRQIIGSAQNTKHKYFPALAIFSEFSTLLNCRFTGNETELLAIIEDCKCVLDSAQRKKLVAAEKEAWLEALLNSIKNNRKLISEAYAFLLPRYLSSATHRDDIRKIYQLLAHRKLKSGGGAKINKLKIAILQAEIKLAALFKTSIALALDKQGAEYSIAKAELSLCAGKEAKAFRILDKDHNRIEENYADQYTEYLEYVIQKARIYGQSSMELKFLLKSMVHGYFINENQLRRVDELCSGKERRRILAELIAEVKGTRRTWSFEKVSIFLLHADRVDDLIAELKSTRNKFHLLHSLAIRKLPAYTNDLLSLYAMHVGDALLEGKYFKVQQGIIDKVKLYVDQLPQKEAAHLLNMVLDLSGHQAQISKYIQSVIPLK